MIIIHSFEGRYIFLGESDVRLYFQPYIPFAYIIYYSSFGLYII